MINPGTLKIYNASAGSGKTTFIIKNYLRILLVNANPKEYEKILILTFTRKSSEDLKKRILKYMKDFSNNIISENNIFVFNYLNKYLSKEEIHYKSKKIFLDISYNLKYFYNNIITIDKFTYYIVKSFYENYVLEIDTDNFIKEVIKSFLCKCNNSNSYKKNLINISLYKFFNKKNWTIYKELYDISYMLIDEIHYFNIKNIKYLSNEKQHKLKCILYKKIKKFENFFTMISDNFFYFLKQKNIYNDHFIYKDIPRFFNKIRNITIDSSIFTKRLENNVDKKNIFSKKHTINSEYTNQVLTFYNKTKNFYNNNILYYFLNKTILGNINIFPLFFKLRKEIDHLKKKKK